jgi:hypothetical protein
MDGVQFLEIHIKPTLPFALLFMPGIRMKDKLIEKTHNDR